MDQKSNDSRDSNGSTCLQLFHERGLYHIESSPLICTANQCSGFYMVGTPAMKNLNKHVSVNLKFANFHPTDK